MGSNRNNSKGYAPTATLRPLFCAALATLVAGCSQPQPRNESTRATPPSETPDSPADNAAAKGARPDASTGGRATPEKCLGKVVPPRGAGGAQYLQEPAVSKSDDIQKVVDRARKQLLDRLCQGYRCRALAPDIQTWEIQRSGRYRCSKAVIAQSNYQGWLDETESQLERQLAKLARTFVDAVGEGEQDVRLAIAPVEDHRAVGGPRAHWLYDKMQSALTEAGAALVSYDSDEIDDLDGLDGTVRGTIYTRETYEKLLEVTWRVADGDEIRAADSVTFPEAVSPDVDPATYLPELPEGDGSVEIHFDYLAGGGFCNGQKFELWLEVDEKLHVRVFNVSRESGHLIYPMSGQSSAVEPGKPVSLGAFRAVRTDHPPVERWIVLAAPTLEGLGKFATLENVCRLPSSVANDIQRGRGLPEPARERFASQSFRILQEAEECDSYDVSERAVERTLRALEKTPNCWSDEQSTESDHE